MVYIDITIKEMEIVIESEHEEKTDVITRMIMDAVIDSIKEKATSKEGTDFLQGLKTEGDAK